MSLRRPRLLLVHAHPDDETLTTGGTIAHYAARGVEVTVLTCTLGEEGEVIGARWAGLVAGEADQLGGYRISELSRALHALGVGGPHFLGGAGRWRDSGMVGTPSAENPRAFVHAGLAGAHAMTEVIRRVRPHVVVTYDPHGSYGHPDHVQVHRLTTDALDHAADPAMFADAGPAWEVPKVYWTVVEHRALTAGIAGMTDLPQGWRLPEPGELPSVSDADVDAVIDVHAVRQAKLAAMRAHATQVTVAPSGTELALSNNIAQPVLLAEHYVRVRGEAGELGPDGREHDLFAGITP
ncbi:N-acetyl-1-D-myo-inositol-2-amino-2-deoxy-alpha-D-glucopyranoside deacetylase [Rhodococcus sp. X156]|uniref:N-acetyl-1-D-myo-inositol-2-amino-2-deoxy-alpha- D-glucopyranoside deacetylase n=1 Tax=Rhodococcus sp. X156 TaxID=2499145 RepID=UPI000FDB9F87|nr:N-acetyl-1-D-myo-inositol-2-amino-2-deoxy-alpha-D-glucopyranoside deacetylase [Rhodococcus sp. X156]